MRQENYEKVLQRKCLPDGGSYITLCTGGIFKRSEQKYTTKYTLLKKVASKLYTLI